MKFLLKILITSVNAFILAYLLPGIAFNDIFTAIVVAVILAILDATIKPLLIILTLPVTIFSLGLFLFFINAFIILNDLDEQYFYDSIQVIKTISAEDIKALAEKYLKPEDFYELVVI